MEERFNKPFLYFKKWASFESAYNQTEGFKDNPNCIIFIANEDKEAEGRRGVIWTHGTLFGEGDSLETYATQTQVEKLGELIESITGDSTTSIPDIEKKLGKINTTLDSKLYIQEFIKRLEDNLKTVNELSLLKEVNENGKIISSNIKIEVPTIDSALDDNSTNPVLNAVIKKAIDKLSRSIDAKVEEAIEDYGVSREHAKGLFTSEEELKKLENSQEGDWAIVLGDDNSGNIYKFDGGQWKNVGGYSLSDINKDTLNGYVTKDALNKALEEYIKANAADNTYATKKDLDDAEDKLNATMSELDLQGGDYVKKVEVYTPEQSTKQSRVATDRAGMDPYREKLLTPPAVGSYVTYSDMTEMITKYYSPSTPTTTITDVLHVVLEEEEYEAIKIYPQNTIYFVLAPEENTETTKPVSRVSVNTLITFGSVENNVLTLSGTVQDNILIV